MDITYEITPQTEIHANINTGGNVPYTLPPATSSALGGVKADPKQSSDTQPVRIGTDGKLYTAQGGGGGSATDVQINGTSITQDGVANIPVASTSQLGAVKMGGANNGIGLGSTDQLYVVKASDAEITARGNNYKPVVPSNLNYAVTAVLTDGKAPALNDTQKAAAQSWLGIDTILGLVEAVSEVVG